MSPMTALNPAPCTKCNGTGWLPLDSDSLRVEPCACQGDLRRRQRIAAARIPRRYFHCRLRKFDDGGNTVLATAKRRVSDFVDGWLPRVNVRGLLLTGGCGSGKTHLAVAALLEIISCDKGGRLLFSNFQDLIQEIQASFDDDHVPSKSELLRPLIDADLLVLDELGSQKPSPFVHDVLYYVINSRYNDERTTLFTTNFTDDLAERIGERLRSRLYEMTSTVQLGGVADYRRTKI